MNHPNLAIFVVPIPRGKIDGHKTSILRLLLSYQQGFIKMPNECGKNGGRKRNGYVAAMEIILAILRLLCESYAGMSIQEHQFLIDGF